MTNSQRTLRSAASLDLSAVTLGTRNVDTARGFYGQGLGFEQTHDDGHFISFDVPANADFAGPRLGIYRWDALAADAHTSPVSVGFRRFTLSAIVDSPDAVDELLARAAKAGGRIQKPAKGALWGGYSGYFADPDGHLWKVATNTKPARGHNRHGGKSTASPISTSLRSLPVTLGTENVKRARDFYVSLGAEMDKDYGRFVSLKIGKSGEMGLYRTKGLAKDAKVSPDGSGFHGFTLSCMVDHPGAVDTMMKKAVKAGGHSVVAAGRSDWGGYAAYFADPDGNLWKVAAG